MFERAGACVHVQARGSWESSRGGQDSLQELVLSFRHLGSRY